MIRFVRVVMTVFGFLFVWHKYEDLSLRFENSARLPEHFAGILDVFEDVVTDDHMSGRVRERRGVGVKFDTGLLQVCG